MQTTANYQDMSAVDALWTLYQQQPQQVREAFRSRIIEQEKSEGEHSDEQLKPYTLEEINTMLDAAEADIVAGRTTPHDESMRQAREKISRKAHLKQKESIMTEVI